MTDHDGRVTTSEADDGMPRRELLRRLRPGRLDRAERLALVMLARDPAVAAPIIAARAVELALALERELVRREPEQADDLERLRRSR